MNGASRGRYARYYGYVQSKKSYYVQLGWTNFLPQQNDLQGCRGFYGAVSWVASGYMFTFEGRTMLQLRTHSKRGLATVREAVAFLGVSRKTLYAWERLKRLTPVRPFPRMVRYRWEDLKRLQRRLREGR